jgi:predicted DNA binding protein
MSKNILIYGLVSSEDLTKIKYVGKTHQKLSKRIHDHIRESKKLKTKKDTWIQSVLNNNYEITFIILETCDETNWLDKEKFWISYLKDLTNTSKGGDGGRGLLAVKDFNELKNFVQINMSNVKNSIDWIKFVELNPQYPFLPKYPYSSYKNRGWTSWDDLLVEYDGSNDRRNAFRTFFTYDEAKNYLKDFKIIGIKSFKKQIKKLDSRVPSSPSDYYKKNNSWINWMDFLSY